MGEPLREEQSDLVATRKWQIVGVLVLLLLVVAFPSYRAVEDSRRTDELAAQQRALTRGGDQLYGLNCASCHGANGEGVAAPALNSKEFLSSATDQQIHGIIAGGVPGTEMPAWWNEYGGPLTDQQIAEIVAYLRSWEPTAASVPDWRDPGGG